PSTACTEMVSRARPRPVPLPTTRTAGDDRRNRQGRPQAPTRHGSGQLGESSPLNSRARVTDLCSAWALLVRSDPGPADISHHPRVDDQVAEGPDGGHVGVAE